MHILSRLNSGPPCLEPNDQRLSLTRDGAFPHYVCRIPRTWCVYSGDKPLVAIIDDEALCSSLIDLMRFIGCRAEPYALSKLACCIAAKVEGTKK